MSQPVLLEDGLVLGSKEYVIIDVTDRLSNLTSLTGATYDWREKNASTWLAQGLTVTAIGMRAFCLIDTAVAGVSGEYEVFLQFVNAPENPRLGPVRFKIDA